MTKHSNSFPIRIVQLFEDNPARGFSSVELFNIFWPDEEVSQRGLSRLSFHLWKARRILRENGEFLTNPLRTHGKYYLETNAEEILKRSKEGERRAATGIGMMEGSRQFFVADPVTYRKHLGLTLTRINNFIQTALNTFLLSLTPEAKPDQLEKPDNKPTDGKDKD